MENTILAGLDYNPAEGALRYQGVRYLLIRPETLFALQASLEEQVGRRDAASILYAGGEMGGRLSGKKYRSSFDLSEREAVEFMCRMGGEIGWGHFHLLELDTVAPKYVVEVRGSPFALAYAGVAKEGVCHLIRGVLGGLGSGLFEAPMRASETLCAAQGEEICRFEVTLLG